MSQDEHDVPSAPTEELSPGFLRPGQILGERYRIGEQLGRGGMGEVWRAFDLKLRVDVALKAMREDLFQDEKRRDLLRQEVRAAREVVSPNVCRIFDLIEADGRELVSMEYVDGGTLLDVLRERGPLDLKEAQDIASQFLAGLEAIHRAGLIHRDVKPENIMLTRAGRVVLMDFGLARQEDSGAGTVSGTPAYMAPEQAAGLTVDARADVYSAGVVLAEMVSPEGIKNFESRQSVWEGMRSEPAKVPDTPWAPVLKKAVAKDPDQRYNSAHKLTRALEDVTLRVDGAEDLTPYPGLASFTEADAEYFFGREAEIEQIWSRLDRPHLLAIVGPSGAGKTSFIRAGLITSADPSWAIVRCTPGSAPLVAVGQAVAHEMAGDTEILELLVRAQEPDVLVEVVARWRRRHEHALLIVDQFEELFTHGTIDEQRAVAELLARLPLEADVFVMLSMRDDFLIRCREHEALAPAFTDLTALLPPTGAALRRAVVQPALKSGYRFEDDELVEEILAEVEGERGALPLLAFALARLWDRRDRDNGLLTRKAYSDIGGVGGALARHAEATLESIGDERVAIVRELFRNLVTAEGTRAVRGWDELLSVFNDAQREPAREVLRTLIDARLLTSYEVREEGQASSRRVEIIHESLLAAWPRLVRWQTRDADAAQLRDQLRQAACTWHEHGRPADLLWSGTAYREYAVWRERYPGGLSELEEAFARAMTRHARRLRRRRRIAVAAAFAVLLVVLVVVGLSRQQAVAAARRAEASMLVTVGRQALDLDRSEALAYAIAALEQSDTPEARRLALRALLAGPPATVLPDGEETSSISFSPDGLRLVAGRFDGGVRVYSHDGGAPAGIQSFEQGWIYSLQFSDDGRLLVGAGFGTGGEVRVWETANWQLLHTLRSPERLLELTDVPWFTISYGLVDSDPAHLLMISCTVEGSEASAGGLEDSRWVIRRWPLDGGPSQLVGELAIVLQGDTGEPTLPVVDLQRRRVVAGFGTELQLHGLDDFGRAPPTVIGHHPAGFGGSGLAFGPTGERIIVSDVGGIVRVWPVDGDGTQYERELVRPVQGFPMLPSISPDGAWLADSSHAGGFLWDLSGPAIAERIQLGLQGMHVAQLGFSPDGRWLATAGGGSHYGLTLWPLDQRYPRVLGGDGAGRYMVHFSPDGTRLFASSAEDDGTDSVWSLPLSGGAGLQPDVHFRTRDMWVKAVDPLNRFIVVGAGMAFHKVPLDGSAPTVFEGALRSSVVSLGPAGRYLAAGANKMQVHDLETGKLIRFDPPGEGGVEAFEFDAAGRLLLTRGGVVSRWDPESRTTEVLVGEGILYARPLCDDRHLYIMTGGSHESAERWVLDLGDGSRTAIPEAHRTGCTVAWDPACTIMVSGHDDGEVRVGPFFGEEPHLLLGRQIGHTHVQVSPDGRWIAARSNQDGAVALWPMPDLSKPPLHTLPHDDLLAKLKALTNLRAVPDEASHTGYRVEPDFSAYRGWETVPDW